MSTSETTASFGYLVRRQRLAVDLTQAALARLVGCAAVTISKIEQDERRPSRQMAELLATHLAIPEPERTRFIAIALRNRTADELAIAPRPYNSATADPAETPHRSLPRPSTPFVGRNAELAILQRQLADSTCHLVSLVGPGGMGKTRLAIRLGELALEARSFPDGVFFVSLEGVESPDLLPSAITSTLDLTLQGEAQEGQLLRYLADRQLLLILDNFEHVLPAADLVTKILTGAPAVKIVVTSRQALGLQEEWFHPIGGMEVGNSAEAIRSAHADAIQLFLSCAQRARPELDLDQELDHVIHICRLLDGSPLAVELAATWLRALSCAQIEQELENSIDILATTMRNVPLRHRSVRAVLSQSWDYLSPYEQTIFCRLSVFRNGFRREAAAAVAEAPLWVVASLAEKSLIQMDKGGRFRIHALLRRMGAEKLGQELPASEAVKARHGQYYLAFLAERQEAVFGPLQHTVLREIEEEFDDIRAAWRYVAEHDGLTALAGGLTALFRFLWVRGWLEEGKLLLGSTLRIIQRTPANEERTRLILQLLARQGRLMAAQGRHEAGAALAREALGLAQRMGASSDIALCASILGKILTEQNEFVVAGEHFALALEMYRLVGDERGIADTLTNQGWLIGLTSDPYKAIAKCNQGLLLYRRLGDLSGIARTLNRTGAFNTYIADLDQAERDYHESLDIAEQINDHISAIQAIGGHGFFAAARAQWDIAIDWFEERLARSEEYGHWFETLVSIILLEEVHACTGQPQMTQHYSDLYEQRLRLFDSYGLTSGIPLMHMQTAALTKFVLGDRTALTRFLASIVAGEHIEDPAMRNDAVQFSTLLLTTPGPLWVDTSALPGFDPNSLHDRFAFATEIIVMVHGLGPCDPLCRGLSHDLLKVARQVLGDDEFFAAQKRGATRDLNESIRQMLAIHPYVEDSSSDG